MENVLQVDSLACLYDDIHRVRTLTDERGYSIVRGAVSDQSVATLRARVEELFDPTKDVLVSGSYHRGMANFQRLDRGKFAASSRFVRYFFFFPWNNDEIFDDVGKTEMELINLLAGRDPTIGTLDDDPNPERVRMSFLLQYPIGGGFMSRHREHTHREEGDRAYVVYLALTTRGVDFQTGGAYVSLGDETVDIEAHVRAGDLVVYRGDRAHGVHGIDRDQRVELGRICGRMNFTTIVKFIPEARSSEMDERTTRR